VQITAHERNNESYCLHIAAKKVIATLQHLQTDYYYITWALLKVSDDQVRACFSCLNSRSIMHVYYSSRGMFVAVNIIETHTTFFFFNTASSAVNIQITEYQPGT